MDALHPAAITLKDSLDAGQNLGSAAAAMLLAARAGRDGAIGLRSKKGRAAWVGERTENKPDPGTVLCVSILEAILDVDPDHPFTERQEI